MKEQVQSRFLECQLTQPEIVEIRRQLSDLCVEQTRVEHELNRAKDKSKTLIETRKAKSKVLEQGFEMRSVECIARIVGLRYQVTRTDTLELIEDRRATEPERQLSLAETVRDAESGIPDKLGPIPPYAPAPIEPDEFEESPDDLDLIEDDDSESITPPPTDPEHDPESEAKPTKATKPKNGATPLGKGGKSKGKGK